MYQVIQAASSIVELFWRLRGRGRREFLRRRFCKVGNELRFDANSSTFLTPHLTSFGNSVFLNIGAYFSGEIAIGNDVMIGPNACILSGNHLYGVRGRKPSLLRASLDNPELVDRTEIEDQVWLGANVTILGGLIVGMGAVVGAGSVVNKRLPPFTVCVGNPCRPVRRIFADDVLKQHLTELGIENLAAIEIVERRKSELGATTLPVVDNTNRCQHFYYSGELEQRAA